MDSEEVGNTEPAGIVPPVRRSKKLAIAGAAVAALSVGMLVGGALGPGAAVAQTATPAPSETATPDAGADKAPGARGDRDCPEKDGAATPSATETQSS